MILPRASTHLNPALVLAYGNVNRIGAVRLEYGVRISAGSRCQRKALIPHSLLHYARRSVYRLYITRTRSVNGQELHMKLDESMLLYKRRYYKLTANSRKFQTSQFPVIAWKRDGGAYCGLGSAYCPQLNHTCMNYERGLNDISSDRR